MDLSRDHSLLTRELLGGVRGFRVDLDGGATGEVSFPAPLHTWVSLLKFAGMPWKERWRLASWVEQLWEGDEDCLPIWSSGPPTNG